MNKLFAICSFFLFGFSSTAFAGPIYGIDVDNPPQGAGAGYVSNITSSYNTNTDSFKWQHTIEDTATNQSDGFWLVVSDGPMPQEDEVTIFYGDLDNNTVSAYQYESSYGVDTVQLQDHYLASYGLNYSHDGSAGTFSFEVDGQYLNDANNFSNLENPDNWLGTQFNELIGVWFAPTLDTAISYYNNGSIQSAEASTSGWVDGSNYGTTVVSEPESWSIMLLGLAGLLACRKRV